jgi:nucleotide-binding universal stress UspA family protein
MKADGLEMIDTVLLPVDGSAGARKAVDFGSDLAARYGARVVLLHVLLRRNLADAISGLSDLERSAGMSLEKAFEARGDLRLSDVVHSGDTAQRQALEIVAQLVLETAEQAVRSRGVTNLRTCVVEGDPAERIIEIAERENADLIVMGSRGLSDLEGLLLGSTSHKVSHLAPCTCVVVR